MRAFLTGTWYTLIVLWSAFREIVRDLMLDGARVRCRWTRKAWTPRVLNLDKESELALGNLRLESLLHAHGIDAQTIRGVVIAYDAEFCAYAAIVNETWHLETISRELHVHFPIAPGQEICQRFVGIGNDRDAADKDAWLGFAGGMFHVLSCVFLERGCNYVMQRHCKIDGQMRLVTCGPPVVPGNVNIAAAEMRELFEVITSTLMQMTLVGGTHWSSLFFRRCGQRLIECQFQLDEQIWPEMNQALEGLNLPTPGGCYSGRIFLIIQDVTLADDSAAAESIAGQAVPNTERLTPIRQLREPR